MRVFIIGRTVLPSPSHIFDFMLKLNFVQTKAYLKIRASTYNAPAAKREREQIEKLKSKGSTIESNTPVRMAFKAQLVMNSNLWEVQRICIKIFNELPQ